MNRCRHLPGYLWEHRGYHAKNLGKHLGVWSIFILTFMGFAITNQAGFFGPPSDQGTQHGNTQFMLTVAHDGETTYRIVDAVSEEVREDLREKLLGNSYPSPTAAMEASEGEYPGNPALAHAVNVCTHSELGKVSRETGGGRHLTWFRKHENNRHYTTTAHQVFTQSGFVTTDLYKYSVSRSYCGCG